MSETRQYRLLIVDDESAVSESLSAFFSDFGLTPQTAASAEAGLKLVETTKFDLAVVDIRLPDHNGDHFILQAHRLQPAMKFIVHTGSVHYQITEEISRTGITPEDIFLKPIIDLQKLYDRVMSILHAENKNA